MSENYRVTNGTQPLTDNVHNTLISYHRPKGIAYRKMEIRKQKRKMRGEQNNTKKEEIGVIYSCHLLLQFVTTI
jgi:hypothetical protein